MKRAITILLALLLFAAVACTANTTDPTPTQAAELPTEQPTATAAPTEQLTEEPTPEPTEDPTPEPTPEPTPVEIKTVQVSNVDELLAVIAPNTKIVLAAGTYDLGERSLNLKQVNNLSIIAADRATCILTVKDYETLLTAESCSGLILSGITFLGSDYDGIRLTNCSGVSVENCKFQSCYDTFVAHGCRDVKLSDLEISGSRHAIITEHGKRITLSNLDIHDCNIALDLGGGEDILVTGCRLHNCRYTEPLPSEQAGDLTHWIGCSGRVRFDDCDIYGNKCDILFHLYRSVLSDVRIYNNDVENMFALEGYAMSSHTITNCDIYNNKIGHFIVSELYETLIILSGTSVRDNTIEGMFWNGNISVFGCEFRSNTVKRYFNDDEWQGDVQVSVHGPYGKVLDEAALKAMKLERN